MSARHWRVVVSVEGEEVLAIESEMLCGVPNIDEYAHEVREAGENLLAFIGPGEPTLFIFNADLDPTPSTDDRAGSSTGDDQPA